MTPIPESLEERRAYLLDLLTDVEREKLRIYFCFSVDGTKVVINRSDWFLEGVAYNDPEAAPELFELSDTEAYRNAINYLCARLYKDVV